jgi:hypothetical protein
MSAFDKTTTHTALAQKKKSAEPSCSCFRHPPVAFSPARLSARRLAPQLSTTRSAATHRQFDEFAHGDAELRKWVILVTRFEVGDRSGRGVRGGHRAPICCLVGVRGRSEEADYNGEVVVARTVSMRKNVLKTNLKPTCGYH